MERDTQKINLDKIKLDRFYDLVVEGNDIYSDRLNAILTLLLDEKETGRIDDREFNFLVKLLLIKEVKQEGRNINNWISTVSEKKSSSLLINISSTEKKYA
ncbi:MAG: hypothetical protein QG551_428 [Patescibacteria group bacterium]|jgi:hypothetical protein|nr:hypothetical protein [Patescibacteria group bacterium]